MWYLPEDWYVQERHQARLREVMQQRHIEEALAASQTPHLYTTILLWLGHQLKSWGTQLEARYQPKSIGSHSCKA